MAIPPFWRWATRRPQHCGLAKHRGLASRNCLNVPVYYFCHLVWFPLIIFSYYYGTHFRISLHAWLFLIACNFPLWLLDSLYSYKYSWTLFCDTVTSLENCWVLLDVTFKLSFWTQDKRKVQSRSDCPLHLSCMSIYVKFSTSCSSN